MKIYLKFQQLNTVHTYKCDKNRLKVFSFAVSSWHILTGFYVKSAMLKTKHVHSAPILSLC